MLSNENLQEKYPATTHQVEWDEARPPPPSPSEPSPRLISPFLPGFFVYPQPSDNLATGPLPAYMNAPPPHLPVRKPRVKTTFDHCVFCKNNGEDELYYNMHTLKDDDDMVICPVLSAYICPICKATGQQAHTLKHCPFREAPRGSAGANAMAERMIRSLHAYPNFEDWQVLGNNNPSLAPIGSHLRRNQ